MFPDSIPSPMPFNPNACHISQQVISFGLTDNTFINLLQKLLWKSKVLLLLYYILSQKIKCETIEPRNIKKLFIHKIQNLRVDSTRAQIF